MINLVDKILILLKYNFLDIFWFHWWVFLIGEMLFYAIENIFGYPTEARWYDLVWLLVIYISCFLMAYRLYIITIHENAKDNK